LECTIGEWYRCMSELPGVGADGKLSDTVANATLRNTVIRVNGVRLADAHARILELMVASTPPSATIHVTGSHY
jgi:hypothetical protein